MDPYEDGSPRLLNKLTTPHHTTPAFFDNIELDYLEHFSPARRLVVPIGARRPLYAVRTHLPRRSTARTLAAPDPHPLYPLPFLSLSIKRTAARP